MIAWYTLPVTWESLALIVVFAFPATLALLGLAPAATSLVLRLAPFAALPALALALAAPATAAFPEILLGSSLTTEGVRAPWLFFTAVLWLSAAWFGRYYLAHDHASARYHGYFLGAMAGNLGLVIADDPVTFFTCFAAMSILSYGLVIHDGQPASLRAGRVYLGMAILGETLQFAGMALAVFPMIGKTAAPDFQSLELFNIASGPALALFIAGFGIKAGLLGLHVWLPLAHPVAPTPASAVLSGSMIKAGLLGWMLFLPLGETMAPAAATILIVLGLAGALLAAVYGSTQAHPKAVLAYSSISQMGLLTTALGVALAAPAAWPLLQWTLVAYAAHHAFAKALLFLGVGIRTTRQLAGREGAFFWGGTLVAALALIGAPLTSGTVVKALLKDGIARADLDHGPLIILLLTLAAVGTTALMTRYVITLRRLTPDAHHTTPRAIFLPWTLLLAMTLGFTFYFARLLIGEHLIGAVKPAAWWKSLLPLAGGLLAYAAISRLRLRMTLPPGDIYEPLATATAATQRVWIRLRQHITTGDTTRLRKPLTAWATSFARRMTASEERLAAWPIGATALALASAWLFWLILS